MALVCIVAWSFVCLRHCLGGLGLAGRPRKREREAQARGEVVPAKGESPGCAPQLGPAGDPYSDEARANALLERKIRAKLRRELGFATEQGVKQSIELVVGPILDQMDHMVQINARVLVLLEQAAEAGDVGRLTELTKVVKEMGKQTNLILDRRYGPPTQRQQIESKNLNVSVDLSDLVRGDE